MLQRVLLVLHKPPQQGCVESSAAAPWLHSGTLATDTHVCLIPCLQSLSQLLTAILMVPPCGKYQLHFIDRKQRRRNVQQHAQDDVAS